MAITFDPAAKRIILDSPSTSATEIYSRWVDWAAQGDNIKYGMWFRQVGGDDLGGGLFIPPYYFLQGAVRIRPMESNHVLELEGNIFVEGGGDQHSAISTLSLRTLYRYKHKHSQHQVAEQPIFPVLWLLWRKSVRKLTTLKPLSCRYDHMPYID